MGRHSQAPPKKERNVPGEIAAAVLTGRAELVESLRNRIVDGNATIDKTMALDLCDLVQECIEESRRDRERRRLFAERANSTVLGGLRGALRQVEYLLVDTMEREELPPALREIYDDRQAARGGA